MTYAKKRERNSSKRRVGKPHLKASQFTLKSNQKESKSKTKSKSSSSFEELNQYYYAFQSNIEGTYDKFQSDLQSKMDIQKTEIQHFEIDSKKIMQKVSQQTIKQLTKLGQLQAMQAKERSKTTAAFQQKERALKKKLSDSERANTLANRLNKRLDELEDAFTDEDSESE